MIKISKFIKTCLLIEKLKHFELFDQSVNCDWFHMNGNYPSQKTDCKNGFDSPKHLNGNQALLKFKGHIMVYTCFRACIVGIWEIVYGNLWKLGANTPDNVLGYFTVYKSTVYI